jgi:hypothetical protein
MNGATHEPQEPGPCRLAEGSRSDSSALSSDGLNFPRRFRLLSQYSGRIESRQAARLRRIPLAAIGRSCHPLDAGLQQPQARAHDHLRMAIALPLIIELLSVVGVRIAELAIGLGRRNEQRTNRLWDRGSGCGR